ncbi:MAG: transposase, partial [Patescibacteria group bacterium]
GSTMTIFLDEISKRHTDEYILMVMDGAPCHRSRKLRIPDNIEILKLPPYSPQLNPVENLWDEMREKFFANCVFRDMDAVEQQMIIALLSLESSPEKVRSIAGWQWILDAIAK